MIMWVTKMITTSLAVVEDEMILPSKPMGDELRAQIFWSISRLKSQWIVMGIAQFP